MNNLIIENFNGHPLHTIIWNGRPCWIASEIGQILNYSNISKIISNCIESEGFENTIEYEILRKENLKDFMITLKESSNIFMNTKVRNLAILYEEGLYGFLQYSRSNIALLFKKWLRRNLLPELRATVYSQKFENANMVSTNLTLLNKTNEVKSNIEKLNLVYEHVFLLNKILEESSFSAEEKLSILLKLYASLGIDL
ncbi:MAG: BRO-N domain-containing protein [Sarcina sp.]